MLYALVLVSAFLHAAWNALAKRARRPEMGVHVAVALSGGIAAAWALVQGGSGEALAGRALLWSLFAGLFESRYFHALGRALVAGPLAPVYTLSRGGAALLIWPLSILCLAERWSWLGILGTALVLSGLAAASLERGMSAAAVRVGLECALTITGYHIGYKLALAAGGPPAQVFACSIGAATALNLASGGSAFRSSFGTAVREVQPLTVLAGVVCAGSFLLFLEALARGGAAYVFTLRNTSVLFATALGAWLGERPTRHQLLGAGLVCLGAGFLGLAGE